jgi:hypothetical protein
MEANEGQGRPTKSLAEELLKRFMANADSTNGKMRKLTERQKNYLTMRITFLFGLIRACHPRGLTYRVLNAPYLSLGTYSKVSTCIGRGIKVVLGRPWSKLEDNMKMCGLEVG